MSCRTASTHCQVCIQTACPPRGSLPALGSRLLVHVLSSTFYYKHNAYSIEKTGVSNSRLERHSDSSLSLISLLSVKDTILPSFLLPFYVPIPIPDFLNTVNLNNFPFMDFSNSLNDF